MSVSTSIAIQANANAAAARAEAARAKKVACQASVKGYQHDTATVQESQQYADCINTLHPQEMTGGEVAALKWVIVAHFAAAVVGGVVTRKRSSYPDWTDYPMGGLLGICALWVAGLVAFLIWFLAAA